MVSNLGGVEILVLFLGLVFWVAVIVGVVKLFQKSASERTIATLVEENRRLREEIAALSGEKPHVETEV
jgi:cell division protein FtsB